MTAYLGLQESSYNRLLSQAEQSAQAITSDPLEQAAPDQDTDRWLQLSGDLHFLLVNTCDGAASTICRQNMLGNGFETWRQLHLRYALPLGTRSIGYLTKPLKPQQESFTTWEFQLAKYEQDNRTLLPDAIKIAILLNETKGPLQQHLQLQAGNIKTYAQIRSLVVEYHRAASQFVKLQAATSSDNQGPAPLDIGATWYNKGKGKKGQGKNKGKYNRGKGISGDIRNLYRSYNLENGYMVLQHIILNIAQMLDVEDKFDRKHAGFSMAITQYTYASIQAVPEPLRTRLFHYILENKLQLVGDATVLAPGQAGYSDQCMREVDSAVILSQHNSHKMMHSKRIQEENN